MYNKGSKLTLAIATQGYISLEDSDHCTMTRTFLQVRLCADLRSMIKLLEGPEGVYGERISN